MSIFTLALNATTMITAVYLGNVEADWPEDHTVLVVEKAADLDMSAGRLLSIYNSLEGNALVKFPSKAKGQERTYNMLAQIAVEFEGIAVTPVATKRQRKSKGITLPASDRIIAPKPGTKQAALIDTMRGGATMDQLLAAVAKVNAGGKNWTERSVRSGIYWDVNKVKGYGVRTEITNDVHTYFLVGEAPQKA